MHEVQVLTVVIHKVTLHGADEACHIGHLCIVPLLGSLSAVNTAAKEAVAHVLTADCCTFCAYRLAHQGVIVLPQMYSGSASSLHSTGYIKSTLQEHLKVGAS